MDTNNIQPQQKSRLEYVFDIYENDYKRAVNKGIYKNSAKTGEDSKMTRDTMYPFYYDDNFVNFYINNYEGRGIKIEGDNVMVMMFNFFIECDPSPNKEYVSWFVNIYRYLIKRKINSTKETLPQDIEDLSLEHQLFFEDLYSKVNGSLETFSLLKKTNALPIEKRDINYFKTIGSFIETIKPYTIIDDVDDSTHTLDYKELSCIQNFVEKNGKPGQAELVFENQNWVIVITHDKEANAHFGKYTTWCTAGTRYQSMFDSYHARGELFVLIRKGHGSKKEIDKNPEYRLQFHFEDNLYMNALDRPININDFLFENSDIKKYFRNYIVSRVMPYKTNKGTKQTDTITYLLKLGYGDEIIKILKDSKPKSVDFSGHKIEVEHLNNIGEITSIEKLNLSECNIDKIPDSIKKLKNLKILKIRNNKKLTKIPDWIGQLTKLEVLDCAGCDISYIGDLGVNSSLTELVLDYNENLKELPKNIGSLNQLRRITASSCDLRNIGDEILNCKELFLLDVHSNINLERIPVGLTKLPHIVAICIDETKVSNQTKNLMVSDGNGSVSVIKYD